MENITNRFLKYISIDSKSDEKKAKIIKPTSKGQIELAMLLKDELINLGLEANINNEGFVFSTLKANTDKNIPKVGFIAHVDTSPEMPGGIKNPQILKYQGGDIRLKDNIYIKEEDFPVLKDLIGKTLITTNGDTLLGADDKAGIAAIMNAVEYFINNPQIKHGDIKIAFTPDEEIGTGCDSFDVETFNADFAYTIDGGRLGELEYESFNAAEAKIFIKGKSVHPGTAKNTMINSITVAKELDDLLGQVQRPEHTEGYEGFFHMISIDGNIENTEMTYIIRDFDRHKFEKKKEFFNDCVNFLNKKYNNIIKVEISDTYYNMGDILKDRMEIVNYAKKAMENLGINVIVQPIRGGTDGSKLSFMGLPTPNLFTGGYNFHGIYEFIPIEDMKKSSDVIIEIIKLISKQ
ncbi:MAG: peptidase T [Anaerococcus hydrogenalis]|uniref:peptidase T n=1 Tax=Anaerococcus hydrogenalis TaxID=33029 RepID=UPI00290AD395|nr:peptidase T [Anaerococcus hydrogenalis]MDU3688652.1 peptidase T [Anaerococcus hydrogenalis]